MAPTSNCIRILGGNVPINLRHLLVMPLIVGGLYTVAFAEDARAADILTVDHTVDEADGHAPWSLRERVSQAVDGSTIQLKPGAVYLLTRCDASDQLEDANKGGDLDVKANTVNISGSKSVIGQVCPTGEGLVDHLGNGTITLRSVRLTAGNSKGRGGAIRSKGNVRLVGTNVDHNRALGGGGGLWADGNVTAQNSNITDNEIGEVGGDGGGIRAGKDATIVSSAVSRNEGGVQHGGGIRAEGDLQISDSNVVENRASQGGGGLSSAGTVTFAGTRVERNESQRDGGGIEANEVEGESSRVLQNNAGTSKVDGTGGGIFAAKKLTLDQVDVRHNSSLLRGGGVAVPLLGSEVTTTTVTNSTFERNISMTAAGGGLFANSGASIQGSTFVQNIAATIGGGASTGFAAIANSTFSNNQAGERGGGAAGLRLDLDFVTMDKDVAPEGAHVSVIGSEFTPFASTFTGATTSGCKIFGDPTNSQGFNLVDDNDNSCLLGNQDFLNAGSPQLAALADNGGATDNHLPAATSPLVNQISSANPACNGLDQRGKPRPNGSKCDIGAVER